jgi:hypothetical protein
MIPYAGAVPSRVMKMIIFFKVQSQGVFVGVCALVGGDAARLRWRGGGHLWRHAVILYDFGSDSSDNVFTTPKAAHLFAGLRGAGLTVEVVPVKSPKPTECATGAG